MIDQDTVVHITFGNQESVNLGSLAVFEYTQPGSNGRIKLTLSKHKGAFDKERLGELVKRVSSVIEITLVSGEETTSYTTILEEIRIKSSDDWELLEITAVRA